MIQALRKKLNPAWYQGPANNRSHFEGWYFKLVSRDEGHKFALIPGVYLGDKADRHSFIQVFDGVRNTTHYVKFPFSDFHSKQGVFDIRIKDNHFSSSHLQLDLNSPDLSIHGELNFTQQVPWPKTLLAPGIMGWYTWVPFMECYHGIISLDHIIQGRLTINGASIDFTGGRGYTEKDWGQSFPEAWVWCQCNHFSNMGTSLTGSVAIIPWIRRPFPGFIFGLWHDNKLYRFTTYTGARLERFEHQDDMVTITLLQKPYKLHITARQASGGTLQAPTLKGMTHSISESLSSTIDITLSQQTGNNYQTVFQDTGRHAGFESAGNMQRLQHMTRQIIKDHT